MEPMNKIDEGEGANDSSFVGTEGEQEGSKESKKVHRRVTKDHKTMRKGMTPAMESKVQMKKPNLQVMEKTLQNMHNLLP